MNDRLEGTHLIAFWMARIHHESKKGHFRTYTIHLHCNLNGLPHKANQEALFREVKIQKVGYLNVLQLETYSRINTIENTWYTENNQSSYPEQHDDIIEVQVVRHSGTYESTTNLQLQKFKWVNCRLLSVPKAGPNFRSQPSSLPKTMQLCRKTNQNQDPPIGLD